MPKRDGTGPMCQGAMTGRGLGLCNSANQPVYGKGRGFGTGRGNNCRRANRPMDNFDSKEVLQAQKAVLEARLDEINKNLSQ